MQDHAYVFLLVVLGCYSLAFATSYGCVRWLLPESPKQSQGSPRYVAIDGMRGYLAFGVYVHHCLATWLFLPNGHWYPLPHNFENQLGATSVALFFMITAFLFWGRVQKSRGLDWKDFFINRFFRIYPLYLFVFALICCVVGADSHWLLLEPASAVSKEIGKWLVFRDPDINNYFKTTLIIKGVTWTLLYEAWFYVSLPLLVLVFLKRSALWVKVAALAVVAILFRVNHIEFAIAATFLGGVCAVYWVRDKRCTGFAQSKAAGILALLCLFTVMFLLYKPFDVLGIALLTVFFVTIASGNTLFGLLKSRSALWLGEISYSVYLCHGLVLWVFMQKVVPHMQGYDHSLKWFAASSIGITPIVILFCSWTYLLIEKPLIVVGHQIASRGVALFVPNHERRPVDAVQMG